LFVCEEFPGSQHLTAAEISEKISGSNPPFQEKEGHEDGFRTLRHFDPRVIGQAAGRRGGRARAAARCDPYFGGFGEVMVRDLNLYEAVSRSEGGEPR
jgi:hypothetical protein